MDKNIIIDGVNVAGCEHFDRDSSLNNCLAHCIPYPECTCYESCDEHPNCYYKQLQRLKQERDKLKAELHSKVEFIQEQRTIIDEYAKEIEIYKQCQGKRASKREKELEQENKKLKEENQRLFNELIELRAKNIEYKSALEEIREIIHPLSSEHWLMVEKEVRRIINEVLN